MRRITVEDLAQLSQARFVQMVDERGEETPAVGALVFHLARGSG
jgi:hypothetical protein